MEPASMLAGEDFSDRVSRDRRLAAGEQTTRSMTSAAGLVLVRLQVGSRRRAPVQDAETSSAERVGHAQRRDVCRGTGAGRRAARDRAGSVSLLAGLFRAGSWPSPSDTTAMRSAIVAPSRVPARTQPPVRAVAARRAASRGQPLSRTRPPRRCGRTATSANTTFARALPEALRRLRDPGAAIVRPA